MTRNPIFATLPAAAMLALAACGAAGEDTGAEATATAGTETEAVQTDSPEPSPSPSPTGGLPEAADGTDFDACFDGDCEFLASEGTEFAIDTAFGMDTFSVTAVDDGTVSVQGTGPGTRVGFTLPEEGEGQANGALLITAVAIEDGEAVIRLSPVN